MDLQSGFRWKALLSLALCLSACSDADRTAGSRIIEPAPTASVIMDPGVAPVTASAPAPAVGNVAAFVGHATLTGLVSYVKLEELSEVDGNAWGSIAELNLIDATGNAVPRAGWTATADSVAASAGPGNAIDGDPGSIWHSAWEGPSPPPPPPHQIVVKLATAANLMGFKYLPRQDRLRNGTIARFRFFVSRDGVDWHQPIAQGDFTDLGPVKSEHTVIFGQRQVNHRPTLSAMSRQVSVVGQGVSLRAEGRDADGDAITYQADALPAGISIDERSGVLRGVPSETGSFTTTITVRDVKGASSSSFFDWVIVAAVAPTPRPCVATANTVCHVKLEAVSEIAGRPFASMAEFNLLDLEGRAIAREQWVATADSASPNDAAANAIDGDARSIWHTRWEGEPVPMPHGFVVHLSSPVSISGFRYLPRQDGNYNGTIARYRFFLSSDGKNWGTPVAEGDLTLLGSATAEKTVYLK